MDDDNNYIDVDDDVGGGIGVGDVSKRFINIENEKQKIRPTNI